MLNADESRAIPPIAELLAERELISGWEYDAQLVFGDGSLKRIALRLSWADYHHWSPDGGAAPSHVANAVLRFITAHVEQFAGMELIDASTARRRVEGADHEIRAMLRGE
ncbi:MAG: hypothetical protein SGJ09_15700 [Phycisphaerae bacterium]|nr:hypothetical protein [Phycisphaerae bacterium]